MTTTVTTDLTDFFYNTMFLSSILFIVVYSFIAPWWKHLVGKAMVSIDLLVILTLLPGILRLWFGISVFNSFFDWYRIASLAIGTGTILWRTWTVRHVNAQIIQPPLADPATDLTLEPIKES